MNIKYQFLSFDKNSGSVLVRYFTDNNPDGYIYNLDVPLNNNQYVNEIEFIDYVEQFIPKNQLQRAEQIKTITLPKYLSDLIPTEMSIL